VSADMNVEQAIRTALEYEGRVYRCYLDAAAAAGDDVAKRVFSVLAEEEKGHLTYLGERLEEWRASGAITVPELKTVIVDRAAIHAKVEALRATVSTATDPLRDVQVETLKQALSLEIDTSRFYQEMVRTLDAEGQRMFERFVEIEEGHKAIVQAEIDCVTGMGYWFDSREFALESG
jgi:rubrerythrin